MRYLLALAMLVVAGSAVAKGGVPPWRQDQRSQTIWNAAHNRFVDQLDYWFEDGDYPRCIQLLRVLNDIEPDNYDIATDLGYMLESTEEPDAALAVYVRFRKENTSNPDSAFPEANFYFKTKSFAKVPPLLEPTLTQKPHPNSYRLLGHSYEKLGLLADSKRVWTQYLTVNPNDEAAKNNLRRVNDKILKGR